MRCDNNAGKASDVCNNSKPTANSFLGFPAGLLTFRNALYFLNFWHFTDFKKETFQGCLNPNHFDIWMLNWCLSNGYSKKGFKLIIESKRYLTGKDTFGQCLFKSNFHLQTSCWKALKVSEVWLCPYSNVSKWCKIPRAYLKLLLNWYVAILIYHKHETISE